MYLSLELFNNLINKVKESDFIQNFINELSNHLETANKKEEIKLNNEELNNRQEDCLYQVVDFSSNGVFLQNTENNIVFEENNIQQKILNKIGNDYILKFKNGNYVIEEELTHKFMNSMVDIKEYQKIKEKFKQESNILENDKDTKYHVSLRNEDYTILNYGQNNDNIIKAPNELIPFFTKEGNVLYYKNEKFEKYIEK